jgi:hypothetical protein
MFFDMAYILAFLRSFSTNFCSFYIREIVNNPARCPFLVIANVTL